MADVVVEVEVAVIHPDGAVLDRRPHQPLPVAGNQVQDPIDCASEHLDVDAAVGFPQWAGLEDLRRGHVHVNVRLLEHQ